MSDEQKTFLNAVQLAKRWNNAVSPGTLANWRSQGKGPPYQKIGSKVLYRLDLVIEWEQKQQIQPQ